VFRLINIVLEKIHHKEEGITGLGTAIILIAFVIVASVFAYVVLSAGLFASQKVNEAVNAALGSTMSVLEPKGDVIAKMENSVVKEVYLCVGIPTAGHPVDFGSTSNSTKIVVISYSDEDNFIPAVNWTLQKLSTMNTDDLLDENELFMITMDLSGTGNVTIGPYHTFALEIKRPDGPVLAIERTIPGGTNQYVNLH